MICFRLSHLWAPSGWSSLTTIPTLEIGLTPRRLAEVVFYVEDDSCGINNNYGADIYRACMTWIPWAGSSLWPLYTWICLILKYKLWGRSLRAAFCRWGNGGSEKGGDLPEAMERMTWSRAEVQAGWLRVLPGVLPGVLPLSSPTCRRARAKSAHQACLGSEEFWLQFFCRICSQNNSFFIYIFFLTFKFVYNFKGYFPSITHVRYILLQIAK